LAIQHTPHTRWFIFDLTIWLLAPVASAFSLLDRFLTVIAPCDEMMSRE
jgi:hypothetical protein